MQIPNFLQPSLKALETISYQLKQKFPRVKRNIKFNDGEMDLVLDFCTDPDRQGDWNKLLPGQAKIIKENLKKKGGGASLEMSSGDLEAMLGANQSSNPDPGGSRAP